MRILFLAPEPFFVPRGTPIAVRAALEGLSAQGHAIDLLTYHAGDDIAIDNVRHVRARRPPLVRDVPIGPSWQKIGCDLFMIAAAFKMARTGKYDLVHAVEEAVFMARAIRRCYGVPYVYDMDSHMSRQLAAKSRLLAPAAWLFDRLERGAIARSTGVLAVCPALVEVALESHPQRNVTLLPDVPLTDPHATNGTCDLPETTGTLLLYVGNLEAYQGIDLMIEAFRRVIDAGTDATLLVVGGEPAHVDHYRKTAGALCDQGKLRLIGPRPIEQLGAILRRADVLLSPRTVGQNTPMKIYSYLDSGKAVLATRLSTHTQVLDDRVASLVDANPDDMAAGMLRLIRDPDLRRELGERGQAYVRSEFSETAFRRRLAQFYSAIDGNVAS